jgi:CDGSH-type Zn-finger protein
MTWRCSFYEFDLQPPQLVRVSPCRPGCPRGRACFLGHRHVRDRAGYWRPLFACAPFGHILSSHLHRFRLAGARTAGGEGSNDRRRVVMSRNTVEVKVVVAKNGPYLVTGTVPLARQSIVSDAQGGSEQWQESDPFPPQASYALCRCGHSRTKPFCDGTHTKVKFDGTETASREPYRAQAQLIEGPELGHRRGVVLRVCPLLRSRASLEPGRAHSGLPGPGQLPPPGQQLSRRAPGGVESGDRRTRGAPAAGLDRPG